MKKLKDLYDGFRGPPERLFKGCFFSVRLDSNNDCVRDWQWQYPSAYKKIKEGNVCEVSKSKVQDS